MRLRKDPAGEAGSSRTIGLSRWLEANSHLPFAQQAKMIVNPTEGRLVYEK
jgi:hypothetical protein